MVISMEQTAPARRRRRAATTGGEGTAEVAGAQQAAQAQAVAQPASPGRVLPTAHAALEPEAVDLAGGDAGRRAPRLLALSDKTLVFASLAVVVVGFAVLAVTWGQVAGEVNVARQLPYVVSGGLTGLALVVVGTALGVVAGWRAERQADQFELERVCALVRELADALREPPR